MTQFGVYIQVFRSNNPGIGDNVPDREVKVLHPFLVSIGLFCAHSVAHAQRMTEIVVVGTHIEEGHDSAALLKAARMSGLTVVGADQVKDRLGGRGSRLIDEALQARGVSLLSEGMVLFEHADLEAAKDRLAASVTALEQAMAGSSDGRTLVDALLAQGNLGLAMGEPSVARRAFKRVVLMDPVRELDAVHYPPKVVAMFDDVRREVRAVPMGSIQVKTDDPLATVHIDGRFQGVGSQRISDLPAGNHHVLVMGVSGHRSYAAVEVQPGKKIQFSAPLTEFFVGFPGESEAEREAQTSQLYRALGGQVTEGLVLIAGETGVDEVGVQFYEPRTDAFSRILRREADGDAMGSVLTLVPKLEQYLAEEGGLSPRAVWPDVLALNIGANQELTEMLLGPKKENVVSVNSPPAELGQPSSNSVPWPVWAGAGGMILAATAVALFLRPSTSGEETSQSTGTGTVVVEF